MSLTNRNYRLIQHLAFWCLWFIYRLTNSVSSKSLKGHYWWGDGAIIHVLLVEMLIMSMFAYGMVYYLVPKFLDSKRYFLFVLTTLLWFYFITGIYSATFYFHLEKLYTLFIFGDPEEISNMYLRLTHLPYLLNLFSIFIVPTFVLGAIKFYKNKVLVSQMEEEKNRMELKVLKNQLNPHFLFNTLNNLYSFVVTKSSKAPEMVLQLSGILDYALYKSQQKFVAIHEEIEAIENFISLEQIRYGDRLDVSLQKKVKDDLQISPLLLLSIVENAFKHGASGDIEVPKIDIELSEIENGIHFTVWNTKPQKKGEQNDAYKSGIGLSNIKRQLDLIYPDRHQLKTEDKVDSFQLYLDIRLS